MGRKNNQGIVSELAGRGEIFSYGLGGFGRGLLNSIVMGLLNYFYTNSIGMSAGVIGVVFMVSRIFDGFSDIIAGTIVDKTKSRFGKTRLWILLSAIPFALTTFLLFTVPHISTTGKIIYIFITYNLVTTVFGTLFYVPHMTLTSLITRDKVQRTQVSLVNQIFTTIAGVLPSFIIVPLVNKNGNSQSSWVWTMLVTVVISAICMMICFINTKERVVLSQSSKNEDEKKLSFKLVVSTLFQNKYWFLVLGIFITDALSNNFYVASGMYYTQYILGNLNYAGIIGLVSIVPTMLALLLVAPFVKNISKSKIFLIGAIIKAFGYLLLIALPSGLSSVLLARAISSFGMGLTFSVMYSFIPDTIEYGHWKTGVRLEGIIQSADSFGAKLGVGLAPGVVGLVLAAAGFDGMAKVQTAAAMSAIKICAGWAPLIFSMLMIVIICFYDLDKRYPQIMKELEERKLQANNE